MFFKSKPKIISSAAVAGPKECAGRVGRYVDYALEDDMFAETTFERAERKMLLYSIRRSLEKAELKGADVLISGDLLNQIISASFAARALLRRQKAHSPASMALAAESTAPAASPGGQ